MLIRDFRIRYRAKRLNKFIFKARTEKEIWLDLDYERPVVPGKAVVPHCVLPFVLTSARQR